MLSETQLHRYFERHQLSADAVDYIQNTRNSQPSRMVGVHARKNVCSWFYSEKMQRTISTESRTAEKAFAVLCEFDEQVIEFWDQPEPMVVRKYGRRLRAKNGPYTPDFLVLRKDGPVVVEVKDLRSVEKLVSSSPRDWLKRADGSFDFLPAKQVLSDLGLNFNVFVASQEMRFRVFNQELILRVRSGDSTPIDSADLDKLFEESFCWSLYDLKARLTLDDYTALIREIGNGHLYFDWDAELLSEPRGCHVVRRRELLLYVPEFQELKIYTDDLLSSIDLGKMPSSRYAEEALERLKRIEAEENGRSVRRWRALAVKGAALGLSPFQSLIPKWFCAGNRLRKVNGTVDRFLLRYLLNDHAPRQGLSIYRSYIRYRVVAQEHHPGYPPVSKTTFIRRLRSIPPEKIAFKRGGKRAANALEEPSDPQQRHLKSELAWQRVAVDHYLADIYLVFFDSEESPHVMRPWVSAMIDLATGCVLSFSISFQSPSRRSVAKVMRDCVRRHARLPREIIVDRGADFRSVYFSALLGHYKVEHVLRPASHSRYGGEVEGLFGEFKKVWLSQRPGNMADFKEARGVDGKLKPRERAVLTPHDFYRELEAFISWRDSRPRGTNISSPKNTLAAHMREYPFVGIKQEYNDEFLLATAVDSKYYKLDLQRGIHIDGMWYWNPDLAGLRGKRGSLEVRVDPENPHVIYGLIANQWVPCYSSRINRYSAIDPVSQKVEGLIATEAFSARQKVKQQADEEVVRIIRSMADSSEQNGKSQVAVLPFVDDSFELEEESVFNLLKDAKFQPLETEAWEVKHVWEH